MENKVDGKTWIRVTIIVAVIGCIGVLGAAVIGILPDLLKSTPTPETTNVVNGATESIPNTSSPASDSSPEIYDDFNVSSFEGKWNSSLWVSPFDGNTIVEQNNGILMLSRQAVGNGGLAASRISGINEAKFIEAKLKLDSYTRAIAGQVGIGINNGWWINCSIYKVGSSAYARCGTDDNYFTNAVKADFDTWHTMRYEIDSNAANISFYFDGQPIGKYESFAHTQFRVEITVYSEDGGLVTGYIDDVRIWK